MPTRPSRQDGYSLVELLVVIAIVGLISLVTVPNFIAMMRSSKFKGSLQQLTNDLRSTRQRAITRYTKTKIAFDPDSRAYGVYDYAGLEADGITERWTRVGNLRYLDETTYFASQTTFPDRTNDSDGMRDVIFTNTGAVEVPPDLEPPYTVVIRNYAQIPKNQYTVDVRLAGNFTSTGSRWR